MSQEWQAALQAVLSANGLGFWKRNLITNRIDFDSECQRIFGYDIGEITNLDKFWKQLVHPLDVARANKVLQDYLENRIPIYKVKLRILTKSGEWKWVLASGQIYERDQNGKPVLLVGTYKDITKEVSTKLAQKRKNKRENLFRELQTQIINANPLEMILEFAVKQLQNFLQVDRTMIYRSQADGSASVVFESLNDNLSSLKGHSCNIPVTIFTDLEGEVSDGEQPIFEKCTGTQNSNTLEEHGQSARSHTELVVPILVQLNQTVSLNSHQQQFATGQIGASSLAQKDYSPGEYPSSHKISNYCWGMLAVQQYDYCREWQDWEIDTLKQLTQLIALAIGQQERITQAERETAVRKSLETKLHSQSQQLQTHLEQLSNLQEQLLENQKMSNLGQLTIDILSEINKPVNFVHKSFESVSHYAQDLIEFLEGFQHRSTQVQPFSFSASKIQSPNIQPSNIQYLNIQPLNIQPSNIQYFDLEATKTDLPNLLWSMGAASERIKDIVGDLQTFVHADSEQIEKFDIHEGINSALKLLQHRLKGQTTRARIQVIKDLGDLPLVEGYRAELTQVFINLINNAIDALEERMKQDYSFVPTIWVNTNSISNHLSLVGKNQSQASAAQPFKKHKVILKIIDNGKGILPHVQRQIFEPLFSTKSTSKARGLGLSICERIIVNKHKGKIKCNSRFGEGSEFVIEINAKYPNLSYVRKYSNLFSF